LRGAHVGRLRSIGSAHVSSVSEEARAIALRSAAIAR
jgi:hypothetical protein